MPEEKDNSPTMVYRYPGPSQIEKRGYTTKVIPAHAATEHYKDGWYETPKEAFEAAEKAGQPLEDLVDKSREELEAEAKKLGVRFTARTSREMLIGKIEAVYKVVNQ